LALGLNDDVLPVVSTADSQGSDDGARRRTASGTGGARPANLLGGYETRGHAQSELGCSSPPRAAPRVLHVGGEAAAERSSGGSAARVRRQRRDAARELGFGVKPARCGAAWQPLNRPGSRLGVRACGHTRVRRRLGVGFLPPVSFRPEVGDDGRGPPVGGSGRAAAVLGHAGPSGSEAAGLAVRWA
jgi:hypothetical protein